MSTPVESTHEVFENPANCEVDTYNYAKDDNSRTAHPLARRARLVCEVNLKDSTIANLDTYGFTSTELDGKPSKALAVMMDNRILAVYKNFRTDMASMLAQLEHQYTELSALNDILGRKLADIMKWRENSAVFINEAKSIDAELKQNEIQLRLAKIFVSRFTLNPREVECLTNTPGGDRNLGQPFLDALWHAQRISEDCKSLLRLSGSQVLGLQLMELASKLQESGYQRLYRWSLEEFRKLNSECPVINPMLIESIGLLASRPAILDTILDEYALVRKSYVTDAFLAALTQGNSAGSRPLELHSYDPLRFCTDMLGWIHQAVATEKDYWNSLMRDPSDTLARDSGGHAFAVITDGIVNPLKVRFERVLSANHGPVVLYKIRHWINFYIQKIRHVVVTDGTNNPLLTLLTDLSSSFYNRYLVSLRNITQNMGTKIDVPSENLVPVASLTSVLTLLRELIICQKSLHGHEENTNEEPVAVTVIVLEPLLQMCNETASHVLPNVPTSTATYLLNCLYLIRNTLFSGESQAGDDPRSDLLNRQCDSHIDTLVRQTTTNVLVGVRMRPFLDTLRVPEDAVVFLFSQRVPFDDFEVQQFGDLFDQYLSNPEEFNVGELRLLMSSTMRNAVIRTSQQLVLDYYKQVYQLLVDNKSTRIIKNPDIVQRLLAT